MMESNRDDLKELFAKRGMSFILDDIPDYYLQASSVDRRLISKISLKEKKLLNIGCGSHLISDIYFAMMGANVTSIDVDRNAIGIAKKNYLFLTKSIH